MSLEENKALVRRYFTEVGHGNIAVVDELFAEDFADHLAGAPPGTRQSHRGLVSMFLAAFPDLHAEIEDQLAEDDRVVTRLIWRGTHRGEFQGIPATGRAVTIPTIRIDRMVGDRIAENWVVFDTLGLLQQLGAIPGPEAADS